jgi:hypothetical protein
MANRFQRSVLRIPAALIFCAAVAAPAPAAAQDQAPEFQPGRIPGWTFTPGVVIGALFDTNVAIASPDVNKKTASDQLFQMAPFGDVSYMSPRTSFSTGYQGTLQKYLDFDGLDGTSHRAYLSMREKLTRRLTIFASDNYAQVPTTDLLDLNGLPFLRAGARHNSLAAGIEARVTKNADAVIRYEMTWVDFVRKDTFLTGGIVNGVQAQLTRRFSDRASAGVEYGVRLADLNEGAKHLAFQDTGGVFRYRAGEFTTVEGSAGVAHLNDRNSDTTRSGPYAKLGVRRRGERASFGVSYARSYVPSLAFGGTNQSQEARGYIHMPIARNKLYVQESASWRRTDPFVKTELPLDSIFLNTVIGYTVQKWFRLEGYHMFTTQDTRIAGGQISRHVAGLQFVVAEPMRIR